MMQDAPDGHNNYTVAFCIYKIFACSQLNNFLLALAYEGYLGYPEHESSHTFCPHVSTGRITGT